MLPLLDLAQRQNGGWLPRAAIEYVAGYLDMPKIRVHEVATFYSMLNLRPVGKYFVQVCRTTPCWLRGADQIVAACEKAAGCGLGETSADGLFTLVEVECLGACCNAPMVQINDDYYEDLTPQVTEDLLNALKRGKPVKPGSQASRRGSEPLGGRTTLLDVTPSAASGEGADAEAEEDEAAEASAPVEAAEAKPERTRSLPAAATSPASTALPATVDKSADPGAAGETDAGAAEAAADDAAVPGGRTTDGRKASGGSARAIEGPRDDKAAALEDKRGDRGRDA